jgi:hypothetical protein
VGNGSKASRLIDEKIKRMLLSDPVIVVLSMLVKSACS